MSSNLRVLGKRILVKERDHREYAIGQIQIVRNVPDQLVSGVVVSRAERCPLDVAPGDVVWYRRNCGREIDGMDGHIFLEPHMVDLVGDGDVRSI